MAAIPNKGTNPVLAAVANFCCCAILGYILLGQARKGIFPLLLVIALGVVSSVLSRVVPMLGILISPLSLALGIFVAIDAYQIAEALKNGAEVDENEYKFELLYKIMKMIDKQAIYKG